MKSQDDIDNAFNPYLSYTVPQGSLVRLVLEKGSAIRRVDGLMHNADRDLFVDSPFPGSKASRSKVHPKLVGTYQFCYNGEAENPSFGFISDDGYDFEVGLDQIADYQVIKLEEKPKH